MIEFWIERRGKEKYYILKVPADLAREFKKFKHMAVYMANGKIEHYQYKLTKEEFKPFINKLKNKIIKVD
ncbi:hypothetical protein [Marinitoga lauensis]|uniref:hypothetical protein n=1 Tax=Marinitoga lauensis TaxID=2201189 RepID=UPI00101103E7|nr:hypothetical protein [Marinitoga lauensis]